MVFLDPVVFYGMLAFSFLPLIVGLLIRWPLIGAITGIFMFLLISFTEGLVVDRPVIDIIGVFNGTNSNYDIAYGETESPFSGETRFMLGMIAAVMVFLPVVFQLRSVF